MLTSEVNTMATFRTKILHSAGCSYDAELPDDIPVKELIPELIMTLGLPSVASQDGQSLEYRLDSKALGRRLLDEETVASADVPIDDTLILTVTTLAGDIGRVNKKNGESAIGLSFYQLRSVEVEHLLTNETALMITLHHYRETLAQLDDLRSTSKEIELERDELKASLREKNTATLFFVLGQLQTGFGINLITNRSPGGWFLFLCGLACTLGALYCVFFGRSAK
jgi:WXG100 protein secretion system (Wss), protein YukD